jgi:hypothetical protein
MIENMQILIKICFRRSPNPYNPTSRVFNPNPDVIHSDDVEHFEAASLEIGEETGFPTFAALFSDVSQSSILRNQFPVVIAQSAWYLFAVIGMTKPNDDSYSSYQIINAILLPKSRTTPESIARMSKTNVSSYCTPTLPKRVKGKAKFGFPVVFLVVVGFTLILTIIVTFAYVRSRLFWIETFPSLSAKTQVGGPAGVPVVGKENCDLMHIESNRNDSIQNEILAVNCFGSSVLAKTSESYSLARAIYEGSDSKLCPEFDNTSSSSSLSSLQHFFPFVLLSDQHSGTTWFAEMIRTHPFVISHIHEPFCCKQDGLAYGRDHSIHIKVMDRMLHHICYHTRGCCRDRVYAGFGIQGNQGWALNANALATYFKSRNIKVIVLDRLNTLAQQLATSGTKAEAGTNMTSSTKKTKIRLRVEFLKNLKNKYWARRKRYRDLVESLRHNQVQTHYITYEDLASNGVQVMLGVLQFLGLHNQDWQISQSSIVDVQLGWNLTITKSSKHHSESLQERIENYNDSLAFLTKACPECTCFLTEDCIYTKAI